MALRTKHQWFGVVLDAPDAREGIVFFGAIGSGAAQATEAVMPQLRSQLSAAGMPAPAVRQSIAGFDRCFHDRATATDPTANPPSCQAAQQRAAQAPPQIRQAAGRAFNHAGQQALASNFSAAFQSTLLYLAGIFLLALLLVLALPKVDPQAMHPPGPPMPD